VGKKREARKVRHVFSKAQLVLLFLPLVDSKNSQYTGGTSETTPPTTWEGSPRMECSAATAMPA